MHSLKGKILAVHNPGDFVHAVEEIARVKR